MQSKRFQRSLGIAVILTLPLAAAHAADAPPNIVLFLADDVGCETLGCYGGESYDTPALDRLATGGSRYRHCYSLPTCHPTRIALLTGRYPFRLGNPQWGTFPQGAESKTVAQLLKQAGYATAIAGKWQLALLENNPTHPHRLGFEGYCLFGWHEGPRYYQPRIWQNGRLRDDVKSRYGPDVYTEFLIDFIQRHRDEPFFAFYSMALCHDVTNDLAGPPPFGPNGRWQTYAEMIETMDRQVQHIVAALDRLNLREKTIVIFTADNGTPVRSITDFKEGQYERTPVTSMRRGESVPGGKGALTDAGTRVPLIVNWPPHVAPGRVCDDLVDMSDFLPTLAALAGAEVPGSWSIDGRSFVPSILDRPGPRRTWAFAERGSQRFVRTQDWKLYGDGRLLDMRAGAAETSPIAPNSADDDARDARKLLQGAFQEL